MSHPPNLWLITGLSAACWGVVFLIGWGIWYLWGLR